MTGTMYARLAAGLAVCQMAIALLLQMKLVARLQAVFGMGHTPHATMQTATFLVRAAYQTVLVKMTIHNLNALAMAEFLAV